MKSAGRRFVVFLVLAIIVTGFILISGSIFETNNAGFYKVKQAFISGEMTVRNDPGMYLQLFGKIEEYKIADTYYFSKDELDGGSGKEAVPIEVTFVEKSKALVSGSLRFRLSTKLEDQLRLHQEFKNYREVVNSLIRQIVPEAIKKTAAIMKAEESYAERNPEFISLAEQQIREGIFATEEVEQAVTGLDGNTMIEKVLKIRYDGEGKPVIVKKSPLKEYNIEISSFVLKDIDFDDIVQQSMNEKSAAYQRQMVARSLAEAARQDAITAEEEGKAKIALARAEEEVLKIREVIKAEKEMEVAKLNAEKASAEAKADLVKREAEAQANLLLVRAGLTPLEKATLEKEMAIGIAAELSKLKFPEIMSFGSGSDVNDPITAIGINQMLEVIDKIKQKSTVSGR
ncbi:MAG: hypothetical protein JW874_15895 [Spirochaetales bacterium]|nr:hypothetical protein [Spirochaetales bacterium]